jgi:A/G-specific adenine glycosylase
MDYRTAILKFDPPTPREAQVKAELLRDIDRYGDAILTRGPEVHLTVASMVLEPTLERTLMAWHNIFRSFSWTGGHADGDPDLLATALRETREETGITAVWPLSGRILGLYKLPVPAHEKRGQPVAAHWHYAAAYGLLAPERQTLRTAPDENTAVEWLPAAELDRRCEEREMVPIYLELCDRMRALDAERAALYARLPGALLPWYPMHARDLPWRADREPYHVWLSEIMLQQTRVEAVRGYYARFLAALPDIRALAEAPEDRLLKLWEGLGYYSRVRNLQRAAQVIVREHGSVFPRDYAAIRALPGVGDYTAGAIASICFGLPCPAVDGNVLRVISRITEDFEPVDRSGMKARVAEALRAVYPPGACGTFTQALMELGATVCVPNGVPKCGDCPVQDFCRSAGRETATQLPVKTPKRPRRTEERTVFVLSCGDRTAVTRRPAQGLLASCWEFPNVPGCLDEAAAVRQAAAWGNEPEALLRSAVRVHVFTHVEWHMTCYYIACRRMAPEFRWASEAELTEAVALPTAFRQFRTLAE